MNSNYQIIRELQDRNNASLNEILELKKVCKELSDKNLQYEANKANALDLLSNVKFLTNKRFESQVKQAIELLQKMNDIDFVKELERRWNVNESMFLDGKIAPKKYEENKAFFRKIAQTIEQNRELQMNSIPDLMTENFVISLIRGLQEFNLRPVFTINNEVRIFQQDLNAYKD